MKERGKWVVKERAGRGTIGLSALGLAGFLSDSVYRALWLRKWRD